LKNFLKILKNFQLHIIITKFNNNIQLILMIILLQDIIILIKNKINNYEILRIKNANSLLYVRIIFLTIKMVLLITCMEKKTKIKILGSIMISKI